MMSRDAAKAVVLKRKNARSRASWRPLRTGNPGRWPPSEWSQNPPGALRPATYVMLTANVASSIRTFRCFWRSLFRFCCSMSSLGRALAARPI
ncbi:hypothetical protein PR202_ga03541 [Eleusine coracana subsp. coracana]|uniref:Uncharacterized protein n=1 Tax=Eleusine coracana subsp. coracana TaxID=191504 RepID=A0AAV5BPC5_ELECO|nr:hypothetical protein PR202_ga03541 [Eleusine coracana subsp. coracana]